MLKTDARTPSRKSARAAGRLDVLQNKHLQDKKGMEDSVASATKHGLAEPHLQGPPAETLLHETPSRSEAATSEVPLPNGATPLDSEIELKLLVDADHLADFNSAPIIATRARNRGTRKHLKAVYYDTPERTLQRNGLSFRFARSARNSCRP